MPLMHGASGLGRAERLRSAPATPGRAGNGDFENRNSNLKIGSGGNPVETAGGRRGW